nr:uncharacterized protein LOC114820142 [Malus domestica]
MTENNPHRLEHKRKENPSFETSQVPSCSGENSLEGWLSEAEYIRACTEMIIIDDFPFSHLERQGAQVFMKSLHPEFDVPSSFGFQQSSSDASLVVLQGHSLVIVLVYVDDILVTGPNPSVCNLFIQKLSTLFPVKDLGPLHYFLGLEVHRSSAGLFLHQSKYLLDLLRKSNMVGAKPCCTPLGSQKLDHTGPLLSDPTEYRSIVGGLQYLTWTRPDISFAVNQICQFMHTPRAQHLQAVKRVLRYLKGTVTEGIWFKKGSTCLTAFSDADWAGCTFDRRSTSGYCIFLGSNLISWSAKKQSTVARSSTEAEYRSLAHTAAEITWICKIFRDIGFPLS